MTTTAKIIFLILLMGILIVGSILGFRQWEARNEASAENPQTTTTLIRSTLPDFSFPDLQGRRQRSNKWLGKILVLNFWATWCPPCRKEIPVFMELQQQWRSRGLQFVGIAIDQEQKVRDLADELDINYPILLGDNDAVQMSRDLGNRFRGLPFSVIFDRTGKVSYFKAGELNRTTLEAKLKPLL